MKYVLRLILAIAVSFSVLVASGGEATAQSCPSGKQIWDLTGSVWVSDDSRDSFTVDYQNKDNYFQGSVTGFEQHNLILIGKVIDSRVVVLFHDPVSKLNSKEMDLQMNPRGSMMGGKTKNPLNGYVGQTYYVNSNGGGSLRCG